MAEVRPKPSAHMEAWPKRHHAGLTRRECPHGVWHPDPFSVAFVREAVGGRNEAYVQHLGAHECDGCCTPTKEA